MRAPNPAEIERAATLHALAEQAEAAGRYAEAERLYREVLTIDRRELGDPRQQVAVDLSDLAMVQQRLGDYDEALAFAGQAVATYQRAPADDDTIYAVLLNNLAGVHETRGEYARAELLYLQA